MSRTRTTKGRDMRTNAVEETMRRHGGAVHALVERLVGDGPTAEDLTCDLVRQLAAPDGISWTPRSQDVPAADLAAQCIALAYFGGRSYTDIAGVLGVPAEVVKTSIRTGLRHLWSDGSADVLRLENRDSTMAATLAV
jgi:DNA-directed RNA polymerase specialized sigma24 family protein